jgi:murein DD-endopeptidase MepM/ murein hydrolase activator NlpD
MNLFPNLKKGKWIELNLNDESKKTNIDVLDPVSFDKWIHELEKERNANYSWGGFLEDRSYIWRNHPGAKNGNPSLIHLGIDYNVPAGTKVAILADGEVVHVMQNEDNSDGWGGRIIWRLENGNYLVYGHLKKNIKFKVGDKFKKGDIIGEIGTPDVNGGWFPHLHVQIIDKIFFDKFKDKKDIDGYLPKGHELLKHIINPERFISFD